VYSPLFLNFLSEVPRGFLHNETKHFQKQHKHLHINRIDYVLDKEKFRKRAEYSKNE